MCKFFSFVGDGFGNYLYSDWDIRKNNLSENTDSHTWILTHHGIPGNKQDRWSKYEYNPLTKEFTIDEPVEGHDHNDAEQWVNKLDFKKIVPALIIKKIKNPLRGKPKSPTIEDCLLLSQWASAWDSVRDSVRASAWDSAWASAWDSVRASVGESAWASVGESVMGSVWASVWDPKWYFLNFLELDSRWASAWAYISTFFDIEYKYDFSSCAKLWNSGFVPSFDGEKWQLYSGKDEKIVYELNKKEVN